MESVFDLSSFNRCSNIYLLMFLGDNDKNPMYDTSSSVDMDRDLLTNDIDLLFGSII